MTTNAATKIPAITQIKGLPPLAVMALQAIKESLEVREGLHESLDRFVSVRELADLILEDEEIITYLGSGHSHDDRYFTKTQWNLDAKGDISIAQGLDTPGRLAVGANNQLIRADSGATLGVEYFSLLGTSNQVTVTHNASDTTLSLSQDIHAGASPTFASLTLSNIVAGVSDYDKFIVSDTGVLKFRTGAEVLSDIGAAASGHTHALNDLSDVDCSGASDGDVLTYQSGTLKWEDIAPTGGGGATDYAFRTITGITNDVVADVAHDTLTLASANNRLTIVGTAATDTITFTVVEANIDHDQLTNFLAAEHIDWSITGAEDIHVDRITAAAVTQHVGSIDHNSLLNTHNLTTDIDHGSIGGLADDDHSIYHTDARGDARYYLKTEFLNISAGAGDAGKPIKLDGAGHVDASMINDADIDHASLTNTHNLTTDIDHGSISGLGDDDHSQYLNTARHDLIARHTLGTVVPHDALGGLTDVTLGSLTDGDVLTYNSTGGYWENQAGGGGAVSVAFKTITGITNDVVADLAEDTLTLASGNSLLTILGTTATDTITFTVNEASIDHGSLAGLADSADHTWALLVDGTRPLTGHWNIGNYRLGINTAPSYPLHVAYSPGDESATMAYLYMTPSGTATASRTHTGLDITISTTHDQDAYYATLKTLKLTANIQTGGDYNTAYGIESYLNNAAAANMNSVSGIYSSFYNSSSGTVSLASATQTVILQNGAGTINVANGQYSTIRVQNASGTIGTARGYYSYLDQQSGTASSGYLFYGEYYGTWTTPWGIYLTGEDKSYFSGKVGIGALSPGQKLTVYGDFGLYNSGGTLGITWGQQSTYTDIWFYNGTGWTTPIGIADTKANLGAVSFYDGWMGIANLNFGTMEACLGTNINEFSTDGTLAGDSDDAVPTEKAVKTYVDGRGLIDDTTPQLGGDLDLNGHGIDFPTTPNITDVLDEDDMSSNSATKLATQQSIKAYHDENPVGFTSRAYTYRSTAQSIPTATLTTISLDTEGYDGDGEFGSYKFTAAVAGYYSLKGSVAIESLGSNKYMGSRLYVNGVMVAWTKNYMPTSTTATVGLGCAKDVYLAANDYVELKTYHNHGSARNAKGGSGYTFLTVHRLS